MWSDYQKIIEILDEHIERYPYSYWKQQALRELKDELMQLYEEERKEFESHYHDGRGFEGDDRAY